MNMLERLLEVRDAMEDSRHTSWALDEHDVVLALIELYEEQRQLCEDVAWLWQQMAFKEA